MTPEFCKYIGANSRMIVTDIFEKIWNANFMVYTD
jgi:hypothetical protein